MPDDRIWATTPGAEDCWRSILDPGPPCDMCGGVIVGLHMHIETDSPSGLRHTLGFCSEACAGRWTGGEKVAADLAIWSCC